MKSTPNDMDIKAIDSGVLSQLTINTSLNAT